MADEPTPKQIQDMVMSVIKELALGFDGTGKTSPFKESEDEEAFGDLLIRSTDRHKGTLWVGGDWDPTLLGLVKRSAKAHGKLCRDYADRYGLDRLSLARILKLMKRVKEEMCHSDRQVTGSDKTVRVFGFVCDV